MEEELIIKEAELYLAGLSFRKIASIVKQSHISVRYNITNKLKNFNPLLYKQVLNKIEENTPKSIDDPEVCKRVLSAYLLLVKEDKTIEQIAEQLNSTPFIIYRDLTKRFGDINKVAPETVTKQMLEQVSTILTNHTMANLINVNEAKRN